MKFLLTNDDGYDAIGLRVLAAVAKEFGEVFVVAPRKTQSGCSHQYTFDRPIELVEVNDDWFSCDAFPADCVRIGLTTLVDEVDWVFCGINQGANLGTDVYVSGTVAAAREAAIFEKKSIAFSHYRMKDSSYEWSVCENLIRKLIPDLISRDMQKHEILNVNFPDGLSEKDANRCKIIDCPVDLSPLPFDYHRSGKKIRSNGKYQNRPRNTGHDIDLCLTGNVTISRMKIG